MKEEISVLELSENKDCGYLPVDIRDGAAFECGHIDGAINIAADELAHCDLPKDRPLCVYCRSGSVSFDAAEALRARGYAAVSLEGGYAAWLRHKIAAASDGDIAKRAATSLRKKYRKPLLSKFAQAVDEYRLIEPNDRIAVCISGGKDSFAMAMLFTEYKRLCKAKFELVFLIMDPGYSAENRETIEHNARILNIPATVFETDIFERVEHIDKSPCYICARMRRGYLYRKARELGCNKIALGHHFDDVTETILMGMLYGGQIQTMMPKLKSTSVAGMELIRPMYLIREDDIKAWRDDNGLLFINCACKIAESCACCDGANDSKRQKVKTLIRTLDAEDGGIAQNIFRSVENVNLGAVIEYKDVGGGRHRFDE